MVRIGNYQVSAIETGHFRLDGGAMFGIIPKPLWTRTTPSDERNRITLAMRCLLLEGEGRLILVDDGVGDKYDEKFADIFGIDHEHASLQRSLEKAGFSVEDVTDVVLTHLHFDHCGGSTTRVDGRLVPAFPNAAYHVQRSHWEWALASNPRERASFLAENLDPLAESGQLSLVDGEVELLPGLFTHVVDGHTRGQQMVRVDGEGRSLVFVADLVPTAAHIPIVWTMAYDVEPLKSMAEKESLLQAAIDGKWSLFFEHDASVEVMDVEQNDGRFRGISARPLTEF
jgi:glyoxylase-like metal-dependent hydrolase (beta-lactamase superfamily II)